MDEYLKPFVQGITLPDKPLRELQDQVLDIFGPLSTVFENFMTMENTIISDGLVQLDGTAVRNFFECIKHAMMMTGDAVCRISTARRELVLKKINPLMVSLAQEEFPDVKRNLFGPGFEQRLKTRAETAVTIGKASRAGQPFFRPGVSRGISRPRGGRQTFSFKPNNTFSFRPRGNQHTKGVGFRGRGQSPRFQSPQYFKQPSQ